MTLKTTYTLSDPRTADDNALLDQLAGIITTGIESGYIDYWALDLDYRWVDSTPDDGHFKLSLPVGRTFHATAVIREHHESPDPSEMGEPFDLTPEALLDGVLRVVNGTVGLGAWSDLPGRLLALLRNPRAEHDFDAEDADIIIQSTVLGDIVYG